MKTIKVENTFYKPNTSYEQFGVKIYNALVENFSQTFFVGGMVRNIYWNVRVTDIDIATAATPKQVAKVLGTLQIKLDLVGEKFGVVIAKYGQHEIQIATFRKESYQGNRYPKIVFTKSLLQDSKRRDFTINSLYYQAKTNTLIDPHDYVSDLQKRVLRAVGDPFEKFTEDPLRIVRGYRFEKEFGLKVDDKTSEAMRQLEGLTATLTKSKIKTEVNKSTTVKVKNFLTNKLL